MTDDEAVQQMVETFATLIRYGMKQERWSEYAKINHVTST